VPAFGNVSLKPANNDLLEVTVVCRLEPQTAMNVYHYRASAIITGGATLGEIVSAIDSAFKPVMRPLVNPAATYRGVFMRDLTSPFDRPAFTIDGSSVGTGTAGDLLPQQTCGLVTKYTQFGGRAFRGRTYVPFPGEADNEADNSPSAAYQAKLATLATLILASQVVVGVTGSTTIVPVIYHVGTGGANDITETKARSEWATQRRRASRGAPNIDPFS